MPEEVLSASARAVAMLDCAPTLAQLEAEVAATGGAMLPLRQLVRAMRGETEALDSLAEHPSDPDVAADRSSPVFHTVAAIVAAIAGMEAGLAEHARAAAAVPGSCQPAVTHLLHGLALAAQARAADPANRAALLRELSDCHDRLVARAAGAPADFRHLALLVGAERAWAAGDHWTASAAFDAALAALPEQWRPWHRALIAERAAAFHLQHGMNHAGRLLLAEAREAYRAWGATAKVRQLDERYPALLLAARRTEELERLLAERTADLAEQAAALTAAHERLEQLAVTDPLTGLANRRRLAELLDAEWRRALRPKTPLAVVMIDVDHFRHYNDAYGQAAGDECLRRVSRTTAGFVRDTDHVARYGGDQLVILLPDTDLLAAGLVAERIRTAVESPGNVTVSIGVAATVPFGEDCAENLIRSAATHLDAAKRAGRNRVATEPLSDSD